MATEIKSTSIKSQNIIAEPQVNKPGSPETGQIIQATGTGDIAKGIYHYSGAAWMSLDNAQGDLETLRLIMSTDTDAVGFSSALNSTSTLAGNTNVVPHETSTGTGMLGALEVPSTGGDALLTEFDANKVFRYFSAGANNNNDYFGIPIDIPAQSRGQNIVIKFKYRTEEASADTSNGDFQVSVWDKSNGVKTTSTNTSAVSAGSAITVASSTGMAVGDKIWLESGGQSTIGNVAATLTQAYITEVTNSTSIKISEDWTPATASGSLVVSGWLSDKVSGLLPSADSDTNKVGKDFSIAVKTEEDTEQIVLWISNKSTTTNVIELFFDGILVSQNKFLQASSQTKNESYSAPYQANFLDSTSSISYQWNPALPSPIAGSPPLAQSKLLSVGDVTGPGTTGTVTAITAKQDITLSVTVAFDGQSSAEIQVYDQDESLIGFTGPVSGTSVTFLESSVTVSLRKNDFVFFRFKNPNTRTGLVNFTAQPQTSDVILLESQDEIFTDWQEYTPTWVSSPGIAEQQAFWRRNGPNMEIRGRVQFSGTMPAATMGLSLPSGYAIDISRLAQQGDDDVYFQSRFLRVENTVKFNDAGSNSNGLFFDRSQSTKTTNLFVGNNYNGKSGDCIDSVDYNNFGGTGDGAEFYATNIPISGWNANFNPLLSMPLIDFGSLENTFSARIANSSGTVSITSQTENFIDSVSYGGTAGIVSVTFTSGFFSQAPAVTATVENAANSDRYINVYSVSSTGFTTSIEAPTDFTGRDNNFNVVVTRQGSDYRQAPQATAAVIKPAVAYVKDIKSQNTAGGTFASGDWRDRDLNTIQGESWFIESLSSNVVTLQAGTYKFSAVAPCFVVDINQLRLYDNTNSSALAIGVSGRVGTSGSDNDSSFTSKVECVATFTSSTGIKLQHRSSGTRATDGFGTAANFTNELYASMRIEKLK